MKRLYFFILILVCSSPAFSQTSSCTQVLRLVRSTYEAGRLHEIPDMVAGCLAGTGAKGFTKEERRETYRYLTLTYIYLEEPEKADEAMLKLLNTDHFFQINKTLDPAEFISLYKKFRTDPVYRIGFSVGLNTTQPNAIANYNVGSTAAGTGKYGLSMGFQAIASFEKEFKTPSFMKNLVIAPEIGFVVRNYKYSNNSLAFQDEDPTKSVSSQSFIIKQNFIDLNALVQYKITNRVDFQSYIGGGPGLSYLLSSTNQASTVLGNGFTVTGETVDDKKSYNQLTYTFLVVAGLKKKLGELYLGANVRYQYGLSNLVNPASRSNATLAYDYQGQYNDYRINNITASISLIYPYFKPKKLIK